MPRFEKGHPGGPGRPSGSRNAKNLMVGQIAAGLLAMLEQAGGFERAPFGKSRIREVSRKVLGRDRKIPRAQALEEGSDRFREIDDDFERAPGFARARGATHGNARAGT